MPLDQATAGNYLTVEIDGKTIEHVQTISGLNAETNIINYNEYNQKYSKSLVGSASVGPVELTMTYVPGSEGYKALEAARESESKAEFVVIFHESAGSTSGVSFTFEAYVASKQIATEYDAVRTCTFSLAVSGGLLEEETA